MVDLPDAEIQRWWANPEAVVQTHVYDVWTVRVRRERPSFNSAASSADGQVWFANGSVLQMVDPSRLSQKAPPAETYIESVIVDRKEFAATANLKSRRTPVTCRLITLRPRF